MRNASTMFDARTGPAAWLKRFGLIGFLFFLGKGLLWLIVPLLLVFFGFED